MVQEADFVAVATLQNLGRFKLLVLKCLFFQSVSYRTVHKTGQLANRSPSNQRDRKWQPRRKTPRAFLMRLQKHIRDFWAVDDELHLLAPCKNPL